MSDDLRPTHPPAEPVLSEHERALAFAGTLPGSRASVSPRVVLWTAVILIVLVGASTLVEGIMSPGSVTTTSRARVTTSTLSTQPSLASSLPALLGLRSMGPTPAPAIELTAQDRRPWSLADQRGRVVLVTFLDANCDDVCPVLGAEISQALSDLGARASSVRVVIVNTNPKITAVSGRAAVLVRTGLDHRSNVAFVTGSLNQLNSIWSNYGVTISVAANGQVSHNNVLYFIDASGRLRYLALPFANEHADGTYSLSATQISRFARGLANVAGNLVG